MKLHFAKRIIAAALAALFCLSVVSCSEENGNETKEKGPVKFDITETATFGDDPPINTEELGKKEEEIEKAELFDEIPSWVGYSDKGLLKEKDSCQTVEIKKASDLAPYRKYFPELKAEEEAEFLADENGFVLLIEITAKGENFSYSTDSVYHNGINIEVLIAEHEEDDPQPLHTFYLYYIPSTHYSGEPIRVLFI